MRILLAPTPITISVPSGKSTLPLVELDKNQVTKKRKPVRLRKNSSRRRTADCSFGDFKETLDFTAWEFFHAAKKTELASSFSTKQIDRKALAFSLDHEETFIWDPSNFRKADRNIFALEDFASAGLAGRVGEAIAYLTMVKWKYVYWDRCEVVWQRAARIANVKHDEQLRLARHVKKEPFSRNSVPSPDFVFEKENGEVALMEAKGSFVHPRNDDPSAKADLSQALRQLKAWSEVISPTPKKSFGIGTYLREESDGTGDPSLVTFVDPEGGKNSNLTPVRLPADLIRRCNYGAWLNGMGLTASGRALRDVRQKARETFSLSVVRIRGIDFAITTEGWKLSFLNSLDPFVPWDRPSRYYREPTIGWLVMGIETNTLRLLGDAIHNRDTPLLSRLDLQNVAGIIEERQDTPWSVMPDGSFLGLLDQKDLEKTLQDRQTFTL
jgi:hypothetical protein